MAARLAWQRRRAEDLAAHGLKPHLTKTFKLSRDPNFVAKVEDIVGLYINPPDKALVLAVDEKSQIQALDRTQPGLPMKKGRCGTMTHDYKRNGTTALFAALNMLDGTSSANACPATGIASSSAFSRPSTNGAPAPPQKWAYVNSRLGRRLEARLAVQSAFSQRRQHRRYPLGAC